MNTELKQKLNIAIAALTDIATNKDYTFDPRKEARRGLDAIRSLALENLEKSKANERIKELEKQCWSHRVDGVLVDGHLHFDRQKFAELIVRECAKLCIDEIADPRDTVEQKCAAKIMKHFEINNDRS
jgi:hypothetical protein